MPSLCIVLTLFVLQVSSARIRSLVTKVGRIDGQIQNVSLPNPDQTQSEIASFLGIPYAESPTGNRRFLKPVRKAKFTETFNASLYGPSCPQSSPAFQYDRIDEDCLNLNIHTPDVMDDGRKFTVMIWIHGGGFILGNGRVFGGKELAVYGQVVVVTINYRLGVFGFLNTEGADVDANAGLYDQHLAIQWVHDNIADFGGDPTRVTIFGESAGAVSVIHQALYPENKGLFQRVIAQSGTANLPSAITLHPLDRAITFAKEIKCFATSNKEMVKCLRARSMTELLN
ncbi:hypothetical protein LOTGIDRAFT_184457, partial [Lottia gigantea]